MKKRKRRSPASVLKARRFTDIQMLVELDLSDDDDFDLDVDYPENDLEFNPVDQLSDSRYRSSPSCREDEVEVQPVEKLKGKDKEGGGGTGPTTAAGDASY